MPTGIEIYIRPSAERTLLNICVPSTIAGQFFEAFKNGKVEELGVPIAFEASVLPEWRTGSADDPSQHIRVPITAINVAVGD